MTRLAGTIAIILIAGCRPQPPPQPEPPKGGQLRFEIRDTSGAPLAARITLIGVGDTPEPKLSEGAAGEPHGRMVLAGNKIMTLEGSGELRVPPGIYDIYVSRGIEWSLSISPRVTIDKDGYTLKVALDHVVDTTGWLSGDFHVHASPSWDSHVPLAARAAEFVVEGVDLIVSTDHNVVADYAPSIKALDVENDLASMVGDEITTLGWGHFGVYPLPARMVGSRFGSHWRHLSQGREVIEGVRKAHPDALIQVNHPRSTNEMGYFRDERFDRRTATSSHKGFSLDFDALEVMNGNDRNSRLDDALLDWFALLDHGHVSTAMGNSDTHSLTTGAFGGYPRNYLRVPDQRPAHVTDADIVAAVRGHHTFFTTGPFVTLRSGDQEIGDVVRASDGKATISIAVSAAPWIDVKRVILYVDGEVAQRWDVPPAAIVPRFEVDHVVALRRDGFVVVRVEGDEPLWPVAGDVEHGPVHPLAITNPLFIDVDGDGKYTR